jgi:hypothetical protein
VPGAWHYAGDYAAAECPGSHWAREEAERGACVALLRWCLAPLTNTPRLPWAACLLEHPFVAAAVSAPHVRAPLDLRPCWVLRLKPLLDCKEPIETPIELCCRCARRSSC